MIERGEQAVEAVTHQETPDFVLGQLETAAAQDQITIREICDNRAEFLKQTATPAVISHANHASYPGYIHPESTVVRSGWVEPFRVNDPEAYVQYVNMLKSYREQPAWNGKTARQIALPAIQSTIGQYYGNFAGYPGIEEANQAFYKGRSGIETEPINLEEFKGKSIAVCAEKAALAQNLLTFSGYKSELIMSGNCRISEETDSEYHAFNLISTDNGLFIYDPTNPSVYKHQDPAQSVSYMPALYPVSLEQEELMMRGERVEVVHADHIYSLSNSTESVLSKRYYAGP